jgi:NADH:ubiquinone oxidoreductase subunit 6 (subunit J)
MPTVAATTEASLNWAVLLPVATGFLAVAYLLPTPRRRPWHHLVLGVVAAALGFFTFLYHGPGSLPEFNAESFLFFAFALEAFTFGVLMIVQRNPARAAIFFAVVVLSVCGLFLLLAAPFLMAATIIIYAGAIIVTFLFVIMLAQQARPTDANDRSREPSLAAAVGFMLLGTLLVVLQRVYSTKEADELIARAEHFALAKGVDDGLRDPAQARQFLDDVRRVRDRLGYGHIAIPTHVDGVEVRPKDSDPAQELEGALGLNPTVFPMDGVGHFDPDPDEVKAAAAQVHFELAFLKAVRDGRAAPLRDMVVSPYGRVKPANPTEDPTKAEPHRLPNANVAAIGRTLFTDHLLAVELGGTLLLVATIGAIAIAGGRREATA